MFTDPKISLGFVLTVLLWTAGLALLIADLWVASDAHLGSLGLAGCIAGTLTALRCMMLRATRHLEQRFTEAFDLGREVGRVEATTPVPLQRIQ